MNDPMTDEQQSREAALYAAIRMTIGNDEFTPTDMLDLAEYIRTGRRGLPVDEATATIRGMSVPTSQIPAVGDSERDALRKGLDHMCQLWGRVETIVGREFTSPESVIDRVAYLVEVEKSVEANRGEHPQP